MEADVRWERDENFQDTIYTKPKAAFLTCGYRQNLKPRLRNAAPSQTKAAFYRRGFRLHLKPCLENAALRKLELGFFKCGYG